MRAKEKVIITKLMAEIIEELERIQRHLPGNPWAAQAITNKLLAQLTEVKL